jgi:hypothetical protein
MYPCAFVDKPAIKSSEAGSGNWGSMRGLGELEITAAEAALRFWLLCNRPILTKSRNP